MSVLLTIHPVNPQAHLLRRAVNTLQQGGILIYPTDSGYALACRMGNKAGIDRIRRLRHLGKSHLFTLVCRDLSELSTYAVVNNHVFRILKSHLPGPYTFILKATREAPRKLLHSNRKTIGIRVPDHVIAMALLEAMDEPLMSTSLTVPGETINFLEAGAISDVFGHHVDLIIDGGDCGLSPTTIVDLTGDTPVIIREGKGDIDSFI